MARITHSNGSVVLALSRSEFDAVLRALKERDDVAALGQQFAGATVELLTIVYDLVAIIDAVRRRRDEAA